MNRYPVWKYILIVFALLFGVLFTLPNFFGESPALQVSSGKATVKVLSTDVGVVDRILEKNGVKPQGTAYEVVGTQGSLRARFNNTDEQFKAKSILEKELNQDQSDPTYLVAFNLVPNTPRWLQSLR